jgi:pyridinium-3,5-biscarboxylic acid mononucleotide synthase
VDERAAADILTRFQAGELSLEQAVSEMRDFPEKDLGYARLDTQRELRTGRPEVVYCAGKTVAQVRGIVEFMLGHGSDILATRASRDQFEAIRDLSPSLRYEELSRTIVLRRNEDAPVTETCIAVVTGGTSDMPVAEEAAVTAELFGNRVTRVYDVGVAGLHRLINRLDAIREAKVIVAVAGMEGALPSVLGGLVRAPVIAVPTSVGYGASFQGLSALLAMLNSCAPGIAVVNIDNGFGAGYLASTINHI